MDPETCLRTIRDFVEGRDWKEGDPDAVTEFTDAVEALDQWLSKGGFLPDAWRAER